MESKKSLSEFEITEFINSHSDWKLVNNELAADFKFTSFMEAVAMINHVATQAEVLDHHPKIVNEYNKLTFSLCTHEAGDSITDKDLLLAEIISKVIKDNV